MSASVFSCGKTTAEVSQRIGVPSIIEHQQRQGINNRGKIDTYRLGEESREHGSGSAHSLAWVEVEDLYIWVSSRGLFYSVYGN